jgi:hypothetical protein
MSEQFDRYMEGWLKGDAEMILSACAEDFVYDDPEDGRMTKAQFAEYWATGPEGENSWSDAVMQEADGVETGWCWFHWMPEGESAEAEQQGAAMVKADADGVHLHRLAYYKR